MIDIPVDFSALSILACGRRYQLSCVKGVDGSSDATDLGNACHAFFEARNKGVTNPVGELAPVLAKKWNLPPPLTTKLMLASLAFDQKPQPVPIVDTANNPLAEYKFSIPIATVDDTYRIVLCGTMDLVYCKSNEFLVIRDYKTTQALGTAADNIVASYTSSLQLPFYAYALHKYLHAFLPDAYADMALSLKLSGEFMMIYLSAAYPKFDPTPPAVINQSIIQSVEELIYLSIPKIISIHKRQSIYPPEGSLYKLCNKCNYYQHCLEKDTDELTRRINMLPTRPYDPTNFR